MANAPGYFDKKPSSPYTPKSSYTRPTSSGNAGFRGEEEPIIFEFGARHFSAGFPGESAPRCTLGFGPEESRRVGDYRQWQIPFGKDPIRKREGYEWGEDHELWRMDVRELDLALVEDKIERAVREAYIQHLLLDFVPRRLSLLLPSIMPHPLLSTVLTTLFQQCNFRTITLLSTPFACVLAAGCRSGLVVDIGWSETVVTAIYEFREIGRCRTTRAMKLLSQEMATLVYDWEAEDGAARDGARGNIKKFTVGDFFQHYEEISTRMAWCRGIDEAVKSSSDTPQTLTHLSIAEEPNTDPLTEIPSPLPPHILKIPFSTLSHPTETALFAHTTEPADDNEHPLPSLIHTSLLRLPPDARASCMSRLILTGSGSRIPGLKSRLLAETALLIHRHGWDPVRGRAADDRRERSRRQNHPFEPGAREGDKRRATGAIPAAALAAQVPDPVEEKVRREQARGDGGPPRVAGVLRGVETLGAWAGGSLFAGLKLGGTVEIEREGFLQHGLAGAKREQEPGVGLPRHGFGTGVGGTRAGERVAWSLGGWG